VRHPLREEAITTPWIATSSHTDSLSGAGVAPSNPEIWRLLDAGLASAGRDVLGDALCVSSDAGEEPGRHRVEEEESDEVQPRLIGDDAAVMDRLDRLVFIAESSPSNLTKSDKKGRERRSQGLRFLEIWLSERTGATGLEPATSGVTGRRSNQLNYAPVVAEV
jgi:hypothetical protein